MSGKATSKIKMNRYSCKLWNGLVELNSKSSNVSVIAYESLLIPKLSSISSMTGSVGNKSNVAILIKILKTEWAFEGIITFKRGK